MPLNVSFLQELLSTIAEQGRQYLPAALIGGRKPNIEALAAALVSGRGEASGVAIARETLARYRDLNPDERRAFFRWLVDELQPDTEAVARAATSYLAAPSSTTLQALQGSVESPRQEFFRRLNLASGATAEIVAMRRDLLRQPKGDPNLGAVDHDLQHLLASWFNRGFLVLRRIDWQTPASILDKIIQYEAVHEIQSWDDLRRRLDPVDRRCFAFFHPSLVDDPLIFVEVALMTETPGSIQSLLKEGRKTAAPQPTTAVFYSISNCQDGLRGISFGNFLIKQVVEELAKEQPSLKTFVTLSPVPSFARWLDRVLAHDPDGLLAPAERKTLSALRDPRWMDTADEGATVKAALMPMAAHYFLRATSVDNRPVDPVARFHLGNGARLERLNWLGDVSEKGLREAHGLMVNYRYDLNEIEANHEAFENSGTIVAAKAVRAYLKPLPKAQARPEPAKPLALAPPQKSTK
jgi:malonyl-CoA decarboxylase